MKILAYNHDGTKLKQVLSNTGNKLQYTNLSYSTSLQGLGSCSFSYPKSDPRRFIGVSYADLLNTAFIGIERIYIEDDDGDIVWGGINLEFSADKDKGQTKCIELKSYFDNLKSPIKELQGNGLEVISSVLDGSKSAITLHEDSEMVDNIDIVISDNATVFDAIKSIIEGTYSRWVLVHEKKSGLIETKLLCRSIRGVTPEGVGIDRSRDSTEVDNDGKRFYIFDEVNTDRTNILNYKADQKHKAIVTNCIVQYKDKLGVEHSTESQGWLPPVLEGYFGKNEKIITSLEIKTEEHAQAVSNREVQQSDTSVNIELYPSNKDDVFIGDRVEFQIFSGGFITGAVDGDGNYSVGSSKWRIEDKTVKVGDGTLKISLKLSARNTTPYSYMMTEKISSNERGTRNLNSNIISG